MHKKVLLLLIFPAFLSCSIINAQNEKIAKTNHENAIEKIDSLTIAEKEVRIEQLQQELLEKERQLAELQLHKQKKEQDKQKLIIYLGFSFFLLLLALFIGLIRRNLRLRKFIKNKGLDTKELEE